MTSPALDTLANSEANARRITLIENCFGKNSMPLGVPGRVLVGEGVLIKLCRKKPKQRQFFLFNDILVYATIVIAKHKYHRQHIIPLEQVEVEDLPDDSPEAGTALLHGWLIKTSTKSFAVFAATETEKQEWMIHIKRCVEHQLAKGKQAPSAPAPVWVHDKVTGKCMRCQTVEFTMLKRRHHCRSCGYVVCSGCSSHRAALVNQSKTPLRVCDPCYEAAGANTVSNGNHAEHSSGEENSDDEDAGVTSGNAGDLEGSTFYPGGAGDAK